MGFSIDHLDVAQNAVLQNAVQITSSYDRFMIKPGLPNSRVSLSSHISSYLGIIALKKHLPVSGSSIYTREQKNQTKGSGETK